MGDLFSKDALLLKNILLDIKKEYKNVPFENLMEKFELNDLTLICRLIDGQYPNYEAVIPNENPNHLEIDKSQLLSSLKRVSIFSNKTTYQVKLKIAGAELKTKSSSFASCTSISSYGSIP